MIIEEKYFIICENRNEFTDFAKRKLDECVRHGINGVTLSHFVFVSGVDRLRGYLNPSGFFIGAWYQRPDIRDILGVLSSSCTNNDKKMEAIIKVYDRLYEYENR